MVDDWQTGIQDLLNQSRVCFLATQGKHGSETSMAPYAIHNASVLLHLSKLARHTANIESSPAIGLMICTPETPADSILALPRLSLQGKVIPIAGARLEIAKQTYLKNVPDAEPLFSFGDFQLFEMTPSHIHWVGGFGKARKIPLEKWQHISHIQST
jgi:putative heme iron utilization protein